MHTIIIPAIKATDAITWATRYSKKDYDVRISFVDSKYVFEFEDEKDATIFALKWK